MANTTISFLHPIDLRVLEVKLDPAITAAEVIGELIQTEFVPDQQESYRLCIKGGNKINPSVSLLEAGMRNGTYIFVVPQTDAGRWQSL